METYTDLGTFAGIMEGKTETVVAIAEKLRAVIAALHPDAVEVPRRGTTPSPTASGRRR
jgi:hypothetical protein